MNIFKRLFQPKKRELTADEIRVNKIAVDFDEKLDEYCESDEFGKNFMEIAELRKEFGYDISIPEAKKLKAQAS